MQSEQRICISLSKWNEFNQLLRGSCMTMYCTHNRTSEIEWDNRSDKSNKGGSTKLPKNIFNLRGFGVAIIENPSSVSLYFTLSLIRSFNLALSPPPAFLFLQPLIYFKCLAS